MAYLVADIRGGPLDGTGVPVDPDVMVYWLLPEPLRLVANDKGLPLEDILTALGAYTRHTNVVNRKRRDVLLWRATT